MRAIVVYESFFGNGRAVAEAVAWELNAGADVEAIPVDLAPDRIDRDVSLLVVGGPNHSAGLSTGRSRLEAQAMVDDPRGMPRLGLRTWLRRLEPGRPGIRAAVYDTRLQQPRVVPLVDHASMTIAWRLRRAGFEVVPGLQHFSVVDVQGPLVDGEVARASAWGRQLLEVMQPAAAGT